MSTTIDNRIVSMRFDNEEFEKKATKSISTLDKLKDALKFSGASKDIDKVNKSFKEVDANPFMNAINSINGGFTTMVAKATIVNRITNSLIDSATKFAKSMSIDQVNAGWDKYADKTSAVQTIMAATAKDFNDTGTQMAYVSSQLDKLNWFTDETSYNFTDMVSNIGKFTSNGIKLDKSVTAMQGIATWAAISGANTNEASRAMYNLSQALSVGSVKLIDWKSIENANMATVEFKENAIKTAVSLGTLKDAGNGLYKTIKGNAVSVSNFNEALSDAWFTSDVLMKTLGNYGSFTDELYKVSDATGRTATQLLADIEKYKDGTLDLNAYAQETGVSVEELTEYMENLSSETYNLGKRSFAAAQEAKTFGEAISATADAVSTGWMKSFEIIFGNYLEAKKLWTNLSNILYEVFATSGDARNELLGEWKAGGGRKTMLETLNNLLEATLRLITPFKDAFRDMFPAKTSKDLLKITDRFKAFTESLKLSANQMTNIRRIARGVFSVIKMGLTLISRLGDTIGNVLRPALEFCGGSLLDFLGYLGDFLTVTASLATESGFVSDVFAAIGERAGQLITIFKTLFNQFKNSTVGKASFAILETVLSTSVNLAGQLLSTLGDIISGFSKLDSFTFAGIKSIVSKAFNVNFGLKKATKETEETETAVNTFRKTMEETTNKLSGSFKLLADRAAAAFNIIRGWLEDVPWAQIVAIGFGFAIINTINKTVMQLTNLTNAIRNLTAGFGTISKSIAGTFDALSYRIKVVPKNYTLMARAIAVVAASLGVLAMIPADRLKAGAIALGAASAAFVVLAEILSRLPVTATYAFGAVMKLAASIGILSVSLLIMSKAFQSLEALDPEALIGIIITVGGLLGSLAVAQMTMAGGLNILGSAAGKLKGLSSTAAQLLALSGSIWIIVKAIESISDIEFKNPSHVIEAVGAAVVSIMGILMTVRVTGGGTSSITSIGLVITATLSLFTLMTVIKKLAEIPSDQYVNGVNKAYDLIGILALLFASTRLVGQNAGKAGSLIAGIGTSIYLIIGAVALLGSIKEATLTKGIKAVSLLGVLFAGLMAASYLVGEHAHKVSVTLLAAAAAIGVCGVIAAVLGAIPEESLKRGVLAIAAVGAVFAALIAASGLAKNLGKDITLLTTMLIAVGAMVAAMTLIPDAGNVQIAALAIAEIVAALSLLLASTHFAEASIKIVGMMAAAGVCIAAMGALMVVLTNHIQDPDKAANVANALTNFTVPLIIMMAAFAAVGKLFGQTQVSFATMAKIGGVALAAIAVVVLGFLGLAYLANKFEGFRAALETLPEIGQLIGETLGAFVGGFSSGNLTALGDGLRAFGETIAETNMDQVIAGFGALIKMAGVLTVFAGVGFVELISSLFGGDIAYVKFPAQLFLLGESLRAFSDSLGDANLPRISEAIDPIRALVEIANELPKSPSLFSIFFGAHDFAVFGVQLRSFGRSLVNFGEQMANTNRQSIVAALPVARALVEIGNELPKSPSLFSIFFGAHDFAVFGVQLAMFGEAMKSYGDSVEGIKYGAMNASISGAQSLVEIANSLPKQGVIQKIIGQQDIAKFGDKLADFGEAMKQYYESIVGIPNLSDGYVVIAHVSKIAELIPAIAGKDSDALIDFGKALKSFGRNLYYFFIDAETASNSTELLTPLIVSMEESLTKIQGFVEQFHQAGLDCVDGLIKGMTESTVLEMISGAGTTVGETVLKSFRNATGWGSPWETMITAGEDAGAGLLEGVSKDTQSAKAGALLGNTFLDAFSEVTGWHSPMKETKEAAGDGGAGLLEGAETAGAAAAADAGEILGDEFNNGLWGKLKTGYKTITDKIPEYMEKGGNYLAENLGLLFDTDEYSASESLAAQIQDTINSATTGSLGSFSASGTKAADAFLTALETRIKDYDLDLSTIDLEQELWEATIGKTASSSDTSAREISNLNAKVAIQNEKVQAATEKYEYNLKKFGETAEDTKKAYQELLREQIDLVGLMDSLNEANSNARQASANAMVEYAKWMAESKDLLLAQGFTIEEIQRAAARDTGYDPNHVMTNMTDSVTDAVETAMATVTTTYANTAEVTLGSLASNFSDYGTLYARSLAKGMENSSGVVGSAATTDANTGLSAISATYNQWYGTGQNVAEGFRLGIESKREQILDTCRSIANAAIDIIQSATAVMSPSRKTMWIGEMCGEGLAIGFENMTDRVTGAAEGISNGAIEAARNTISQIADVLDADSSLHPEITPVLNLSEVRRGINGVSSSLSGSAFISTRVSSMQAAYAGNSMNRDAHSTNQSDVNSGQNGAQSFSFIQNNYSPKTLSRAEIYRNTNNQFSAFKEAVSKA